MIVQGSLIYNQIYMIFPVLYVKFDDFPLTGKCFTIFPVQVRTMIVRDCCSLELTQTQVTGLGAKGVTCEIKIYIYPG